MTFEEAYQQIRKHHYEILNERESISKSARLSLSTWVLELLTECLDESEQTEPNSSEFPNNCEHITEDGVTCAKYPACDDCLDNPLNKVKGSERLLKGSEQAEQTEPQTETQTETQNSNLTFEKRTMLDCYNCKRFETEDECIECHYEPTGYNLTPVEDEAQTCSVNGRPYTDCCNCEYFRCGADEPQTDNDKKYGKKYGKSSLHCVDCTHYGDYEVCIKCDDNYSRYKSYYEPKDEPQTERSSE